MASRPGDAVTPHRSERIERTCGGDAATRALIEALLDVALRGLPLMYDAEKRCFAHSLARGPSGALERRGESLRQAGAVMLGARWLDEAAQRSVFGGESARELCSRAIEGVAQGDDLGDAALVAWAAAELAHPDAERALARALALESAQTAPLTIELAWLLVALTASHHRPTEADARRLGRVLLDAFPVISSVFPHRLAPVGTGLRGHVASFADQVHAIHALSRLHRRFRAERALRTARACADHLCAVQGAAGQWWWHYDVRSGAVLEGYPVYSVHQDAMAPMALLDVEEASGASYRQALVRGLGWMREAPEVGCSLIDDEQPVIWRKVERVGPPKMMRAVRAAVSRVHEDLRLHMLESALPPRRLVWESRPYHLGWVLHAWLTRS